MVRVRIEGLVLVMVLVLEVMASICDLAGRNLGNRNNRLVNLAGRNPQLKSARQFGGKESAIEIHSSIWREEIGNRK